MSNVELHLYCQQIHAMVLPPKHGRMTEMARNATQRSAIHRRYRWIDIPRDVQVSSGLDWLGLAWGDLGLHAYYQYGSTDSSGLPQAESDETYSMYTNSFFPKASRDFRPARPQVNIYRTLN